MIQQHKKILDDKTTETASNTDSSANAVQLKNNREYSVMQHKLAQKSVNQPVSFTPVQRKINNTGLPNNLKFGIENLSGHSMDDVKVHYNSDKPAQLNAHAYAQGTNIHLASGQEKHLPHEAWHVVQQKQGRVKPTIQMKGRVNVNDDKDLEKEADVMGAKSLTIQKKNNKNSYFSVRTTQLFSVVQRKEVTIDEQTFDTDDNKTVWDTFYIFQEDGNIEGFIKLISELKHKKALSKRLKQKWRKLENKDLRERDEPAVKRRTKRNKKKQNQFFKKPLVWEQKPIHSALEESDVTEQEVTAYKNDVENSSAWGTIDQAKTLALKYFIKFNIYVPVGNGNIIRSETIGKGRSYGRSLYFQGGNHFQVIIQKENGPFSLKNSTQKFALNNVLPRSDGSCLYDACYIIRYNKKANNEEIAKLRKYASRNTPTKAIKSEIRDLKGDKRNGRKIFGLGPEMKRILKTDVPDKISPEDLAAIHALYLEDMLTGGNTYQKDIELFYAEMKKEKKTVPKTKGKKNDLMVMGAHMSGDMYGVAASLALKPNMSVLIVTDKKHKGSETAMVDLFRQTIGSDRVYTEETENANSDWHKIQKSPGDRFKDFHTIPVTTETTILAEHFKNNAVETYKTIKESWIGTDKEKLQKEEEATIKFLEAIEMPPGNYALLWSKTGSLTHPHPQHYSSAESQNYLIDEISSMGWSPVNIGDDVAAKATKPSLIKFWDNKNYPVSFKLEGRIGQLKMLYYISRLSGYNIVSVGMRSGILEGPALLGLKVIYLEERGNAQAERWEKLLGNVPSFKRVLLDTPPGGIQKKHWIERILWRDYKSEVFQTAKDKIAKEIDAEPNAVMGILLDHEDLKEATEPLIKISKLQDKSTLEEKLTIVLTEANKDFKETTGGKENWVAERLKEYKTKAAKEETGEGLSNGELGTIKHLLVSWNDAPDNSKHITTKEFHKRTWGKSKEIDDSRDFQIEYLAKKLVHGLTPQNDRNKIALIRSQHPELNTTHAFQNLEVYFRLKIISDFKNEFATRPPELKDGVLTPILEELKPQLGTIAYELNCEKSGNPNYDLDFLLKNIKNPEKILQDLIGGGLNSEEIAGEFFKLGEGNLIISFNIWKMRQNKIAFLPQYKNAALLQPPLVGKQKEVYKLQENHNKVLAKMLPGKNDYFKLIMEEINMITILNQYKGLGVISIDGITLHNGMPAMVMNYYPEHSKDYIAKTKEDFKYHIIPDTYKDFDGQLIKMAKVVNKNTVTKLLEIEKLMFEQKVRIKDLQFLIDSEGTPVIADPGTVVQNTLPSDGEIGVIENLLATTVNKLLLDTGINPKTKILENKLAEQILSVTDIPKNDIRVKSIIKLLIKRYKYNITENSETKYEDTFKVREEPKKAVDPTSIPKSDKEKIIDALKTRMNFFIPWSELQKETYDPKTLGGVDYETACGLITGKKTIVSRNAKGISLKSSDIQKLTPQEKIIAALKARTNFFIPWTELQKETYDPKILGGVDYETASGLITGKKPIVSRNAKGISLKSSDTQKLTPQEKLLAALNARVNFFIPWAELQESTYDPEKFYGLDYKTINDLINGKESIVNKDPEGITLKK
jgi:hypothetical protein